MSMAFTVVRGRCAVACRCALSSRGCSGSGSDRDACTRIMSYHVDDDCCDKALSMDNQKKEDNSAVCLPVCECSVQVGAEKLAENLGINLRCHAKSRDKMTVPKAVLYILSLSLPRYQGKIAYIPSPPALSYMSNVNVVAISSWLPRPKHRQIQFSQLSRCVRLRRYFVPISTPASSSSSSSSSLPSSSSSS